ncbi:MAG TPA: hypothetical protein VKV04_05230 [Verrucomicrobiae bacterium]|nr:hypothetical protein [Verrucomicrobiae bacterium]
MKLPRLLILSVACNVALAIVFLTARPKTAPNSPSPSAIAAPVVSKKAAPVPAATPIPTTIVPWRQIESADYRQYIASLRAVDCPEWLVRQIIVADIDDLYRQRAQPEPLQFNPWQAAEERSRVARNRSARLTALRQEKLALVKSLLGCECENIADKIWSQDLSSTFTLGFLPDEKAARVLLLENQFADTAQKIREDAHFILLDEDQKKLQSLYEGFQTALAGELDPAQLEEFQLRAQQRFLIANDIHFDAVPVTSGEVREIVGFSKSVKDMAREGFDEPPSEAGLASRMDAFNAQVKSVLGAARFVDYERAQHIDFRETLDFAQRSHLPPDAAVRVYELRENTGRQAAEIRDDTNMSAEERAAALVLLRSAAMKNVASAFGDNCQDYLSSSGQWLNEIVPMQTVSASTQ